MIFCIIDWWKTRKETVGKQMIERGKRLCPQCRRETSWDDNPWKPFCSERCQMFDLGNWASESYRVPLTETSDELLADFDRHNTEYEK